MSPLLKLHARESILIQNSLVTAKKERAPGNEIQMKKSIADLIANNSYLDSCRMHAPCEGSIRFDCIRTTIDLLVS